MGLLLCASKTQLDRFTVGKQLEDGLVGETYRASDAMLGRDVRIEILPDTVTKDSNRLAHLKHVTTILTSQHHPNIAEVYGLETIDSVRVINSELLEGETLAERLAKGLFPLRESLSIARGVACALQAAHDNDVVHGALTTRCVTFLSTPGAVKVFNFGLAPWARAGDKRSDVWAYGCLLFELLTGLQPFSGVSPSVTPETTMRADPKWDYLPPLPAAVDTMLRGCLERVPSRRPEMAAVTAVLDMVLAQDISPKADTGRLGLSLAGGGFRASLFHVGVLRRLAELDILRRVEVLSTVSGGSITGALYALLLKKYLEKADGESPRLTRDQYVEIVKTLEELLKNGVQKDLRTRLLLNPVGNLLTIIAGDSISRRMARIYERQLMASIVNDLKVDPPNRWLPAWLRAGQIRLRDLTIRPGGKDIRDVAQYNQEQRSKGGSVLTRLVLNATSVNSSGRFFFSAEECGDWYLGYFREDEFDDVLARKALLELDDDQLASVAKGGTKPPARSGPWRDPTEAQRAATIAYWWRAGSHVRQNPTQTRNFRPGSSGDSLENNWPSLSAPLNNQFLQVAPGLLRRAKVAACDLLEESSDKRRMARFVLALKDIDPDLESLVSSSEPSVLTEIADYVLQLYWVRSAQRISQNIVRDWNDIRLGHAVGASACFPPVFPPFIFHGLYDDVFTMRLGLTDGGVYDNMGITALMDEKCTEIIASDTGGLFKDQLESTTNSFGLLRRIPDLLTHSLGGVQRERMRERRQISRSLGDLVPKPGEKEDETQKALADLHSSWALDSLVYFHITSPFLMPAMHGQYDPIGPVRPPNPDPRDIARLRTDLDGFGETEVAALVNHGYDITDRYVRRHAPTLVRDSLNGQAPPAPDLPLPDVSPEWAHRILAVGSERFFRALRIGSVMSWVGTLLAAILVIGSAWMAGLTINRVFALAASLVHREIALFDRAMRLVVPDSLGPASRSPVVLLVLLVTCVVWVLWRVSRIPRRESTPSRSGWRLKWTRTFKTVFKYVRAAKGNLLWGLLGLPVVLALLMSAVALFSYLFFHLPYMRATQLARAKRPG